MPYAARTRVPISRTKTDIEELLAQHGATGFAYASEGDRSLVAFSMSGRRVQIMLVMLLIDDYAQPPYKLNSVTFQFLLSCHCRLVRRAGRVLATPRDNRAFGSCCWPHHPPHFVARI